MGLDKNFRPTLRFFVVSDVHYKDEHSIERDRMQQAMLVARDAELAMYSHNVEYKCNPDVYMKINELLTKKT